MNIPHDQYEPITQWATDVTYPPNHHSHMAGTSIRVPAGTDRDCAQTRARLHRAKGAAVAVLSRTWTPGEWTTADPDPQEGTR